MLFAVLNILLAHHEYFFKTKMRKMCFGHRCTFLGLIIVTTDSCFVLSVFHGALKDYLIPICCHHIGSCNIYTFCVEVESS